MPDEQKNRQHEKLKEVVYTGDLRAKPASEREEEKPFAFGQKSEAVDGS